MNIQIIRAAYATCSTVLIDERWYLRPYLCSCEREQMKVRGCAVVDTL